MDGLNVGIIDGAKKIRKTLQGITEGCAGSSGSAQQRHDIATAAADAVASTFDISSFGSRESTTAGAASIDPSPASLLAVPTSRPRRRPQQRPRLGHRVPGQAFLAALRTMVAKKFCRHHRRHRKRQVGGSSARRRRSQRRARPTSASINRSYAATAAVGRAVGQIAGKASGLDKKIDATNDLLRQLVKAQNSDKVASLTIPKGGDLIRALRQPEEQGRRAAPMTIYLGPVGALQSLPSVGRGFAANVALGTAAHEIAGGRGGRVVDRVGAPPADLDDGPGVPDPGRDRVLEGLALGGYGRGRSCCWTRGKRNLLSPNQSSGTTCWTTRPGSSPVTGSVSSSTAQADAGQRSLAWAVTAATQRVMTGATAGDHHGAARDRHPGPSVHRLHRPRPGPPVGVDRTVRLDVFWYKADGTAASTASNSGSTQALATGSFTSFTVSATSPADAALARLSVDQHGDGCGADHLPRRVAGPSRPPPWTRGRSGWVCRGCAHGAAGAHLSGAGPMWTPTSP